MTSSDQNLETKPFTLEQAKEFGKALFAGSDLSIRDKVRMFIFGAADLDCPLSHFREEDLTGSTCKVIAGIIGHQRSTSVWDHVLQLSYGDVGLIRKNSDGHYRINLTQMNEKEWELLIDLRHDLETRWIDDLRYNTDALDEMKEANVEMDRAREDILTLVRKLEEQPDSQSAPMTSYKVRAKLFRKVHTFLKQDRRFHLAGVQGNEVAKSVLAIVFDRLRLDLPMQRRIEVRIRGNEGEKKSGSVYEHTQIIAALEQPNTDKQYLLELIEPHIRQR